MNAAWAGIRLVFGTTQQASNVLTQRRLSTRPSAQPLRGRHSLYLPTEAPAAQLEVSATGSFSAQSLQELQDLLTGQECRRHPPIAKFNMALL